METEEHSENQQVVSATAEPQPLTERAEQVSLATAAAPKRSPRVALLVLGPLVIAIAGCYYYMTSGRYIGTENAYVKTHKIAISSDVEGRVQSVEARENDTVAVGQVLFKLDPRPFQITLARAEAELGVVSHEIESYRTAYRQQLAALSIGEDEVDFAQREFDRQKTLKKRGIASEAAYDEKRHALEAAKRRILSLQEDIGSALARLGGNAELATEDHPRYRQALTQRDQALLDLDRTTVRAPAAGVINNVNLQAGEYVEQGVPTFSLVTSDSQWVTANLKETELTHLQVGQDATLRADAYPDHLWKAVVDSIAPATGAEFSLLPPQNASGNWVKVVQRVPVRLAIVDPVSGPPLRAGMSVEVTIDTGFKRPLPGPLRSALTWIKEYSEANASAESSYTSELMIE